jgi:hypothetical protein
MPRPGRFLVCVAIVATLLTACTTHTTTSHAAATHAPPVVTTNGGGASPAPGGAGFTCQEGYQAGPSDLTGLTVALGAVALPNGMVLGASAAAAGAPEALFAKAVLVLRADAEFDLEVPPALAPHVRIGWGNPGTPGTKLHVNACASRNGWMWYPGGYWVDKPVCLPLIVRAGGQEETVNIPIGVGCPASS